MGRELAYRLAQKGYRLVFAPSALVYKRHVFTLGQYLSEQVLGFLLASSLARLAPQAFDGGLAIVRTPSISTLLSLFDPGFVSPFVSAPRGSGS